MGNTKKETKKAKKKKKLNSKTQDEEYVNDGRIEKRDAMRT